MRKLETISELRVHLDKIRRAGQRVALVPTMGAIHEGHRSLMRAARADCDEVVVTIFVNPTQFGPGEDHEQYPRPMDRDFSACRQERVDTVFVPSVSEVYPAGDVTTVSVARLTDVLCGPTRPGHFDGVTTVVAKLLNIVAPDSAYFGQKDAQQAVVIRRMVRDLNLDVEIVTAPTVREADGLALSSRNAHLSPEERRDARVLFRSLESARERLRTGERETSKIIEAMKAEIEAKPAARIDYAAIVDAKTLEPVTHVEGQVLVALAVWIGNTRLIDNVVLCKF